MGVYIYSTTPKAVKVLRLRDKTTGEISMTPVQVYKYMDKLGNWEDQDRQDKRKDSIRNKFQAAGTKPLALGVVKYSGGISNRLFYTDGSMCPVEPEDVADEKLPQFEII